MNPANKIKVLLVLLPLELLHPIIDNIILYPARLVSATIICSDYSTLVASSTLSRLRESIKKMTMPSYIIL
jgi:hypothetical protein